MFFTFVNLILWEFSTTYELCLQKPRSAANNRNKQHKIWNNEELLFKNNIREQEQTKPDSKRSVKSAKRKVAVEPERNSNLWTKQQSVEQIEVFWVYKFPSKYDLKIQAKIYFI